MSLTHTPIINSDCQLTFSCVVSLKENPSPFLVTVTLHGLLDTSTHLFSLKLRLNTNWVVLATHRAIVLQTLASQIEVDQAGDELAST